MAPPGNFNGFRVLAAALLHGTLVVGVSQTAASNEGATYIRQGDHHVGHWPTFLVMTKVCHVRHLCSGTFLTRAGQFVRFSVPSRNSASQFCQSVLFVVCITCRVWTRIVQENSRMDKPECSGRCNAVEVRHGSVVYPVNHHDTLHA